MGLYKVGHGREERREGLLSPSIVGSKAGVSPENLLTKDAPFCNGITEYKACNSEILEI